MSSFMFEAGQKPDTGTVERFRRFLNGTWVSVSKVFCEDKTYYKLSGDSSFFPYHFVLKEGYTLSKSDEVNLINYSKTTQGEIK